MKKRETVKNREDFNNIINNGKSVKTVYFIIYSLQNKLETPLFGIAVSKKIGNSVVRNKLKRQYRNIIDQNKLLFSNNNNYIIMIKKASLTVPFAKINQVFRETLEKEKHEEI